MEIKNNSIYEVLTPSGWQDFSGIKKDVSQTITIFFDEKYITCTKGHYFNNIRADSLKVGDLLEKRLITNIIENEKEEDVFDLLDVNGGNVYYTNKLISHNCHFLGSSSLLVNTETLLRLESTSKTPLRYTHDGFGKVFKEAEIGHLYIHICDSAKGSEDGSGDYITITTIDITKKYEYETVNTYRCNTINDLDAPYIIRDIYERYGGYIICESNISEQIPYILYYDLNIENILCSGVDSNIAKTNTLLVYTPAQKNLGVRMDKKIKKDGCDSLRKLLEEDRFQPSDPEVHHELKTFIKTNKTFNADVGYNDDMVSPLVIFGWAERQPLFTAIIEEIDLNSRADDNGDADLVYFTGVDGKLRTLDKNNKTQAPCDKNWNFFFGNEVENNESEDYSWF